MINLRFTVVGMANSATDRTNLTFTGFVFNEVEPAAKPTGGRFVVLGTTAATVSVSGRVMTSGRGVARARVLFTDAAGNARTATTNSFGYYHFDNVEVGQTYVFEDKAKGKQFTSQAETVNDTIKNLNFSAEP